MPTWEDFTDWAIKQASESAGRKALRRRWKTLRKLADQVATKVSSAEVEGLFGKSYDKLDPEHNDLKALVAYGIGKGLLTDPKELQSALETDVRADPLHFLAQHSGKTFGEKFSPLFAHFWLAEPGDHWRKLSSKGLYDVGWKPQELKGREIRIEIKASSEHPSYRFQQIRHPKMSGSDGDYDLLLCLGVSAGTLEWWSIPADHLGDFTENGTTNPDRVAITRHHGKRRNIWNEEHGYGDEGWFCMDEKVRKLFTSYACDNSEQLRTKVLSFFLLMHRYPNAPARRRASR